jgi:putative protease
MPKAPELLLPAGSLAKMHAAFDFGADAVYAGQPRYSLRARNNEFSTPAELGEGIDQAHARGKLFFVASNIFPHNGKLKTYLRDMRPVIEAGPDALIMADPGLIMMVRDEWPDMPIHLSVQANAVNWADVKFWQKMGLARVILSRELSLDEIDEIRQRCPDIELEVFVHGAMCIAYSGRCLLSGYFSHRDANQGTCTNSCRWDYKVGEATEDAAGDLVAPTSTTLHYAPAGADPAARSFSSLGDLPRHPRASEPYMLEEGKRPGSLMPMFEDEHGTYIMNSKDLRAVEHVARLVDIGVDSLKIEGRTKSRYYAARAAQVYRRAIDDAVAGKPFDPGLLGQLQGLANRGYTDGFYPRHHTREHQNYMEGASRLHQSQYAGDVLSVQDGWADIEVRNRFGVGDRIEVVHPLGNRIVPVEQMRAPDGSAISVAPGSGHRVQIRLDGPCDNAMLARLLD